MKLDRTHASMRSDYRNHDRMAEPALPPALPASARDAGRAGRAAQLLCGRQRAAAAAGPQHQRRGLGLRGQADLRAHADRHGPTPWTCPGYGFSDRCDRRYEPALFVAAIHDMLDTIAADVGAGADRRAGDLAVLGVSGPRGNGTAGADPQLALVTPTGFSPDLRHAATERSPDPRSAGPLPVLHGAAVEPGLLRPAGEPPEHPLLPAADLGLEDDRRGSAGLRLPDHASARRQERALCLRVGTAVQPRHPVASTSGWRCRSGCRTPRAAISRISARLAGPPAGRTGGCSPTTPVPCPISNDPGSSWRTTTVSSPMSRRLSRRRRRPSRGRPARSAAA